MFYVILFSLVCFSLALLGAGIIFIIKKDSDKIDAFLHAFSSGIMLASSIFSLIISSIEYSETLNIKTYIVLPICFALAWLIFLILNSLSKTGNMNMSMLMIGVGLHNIPEGLSVGFAFASATALGTHNALMSAIMIALGIGIQNIPEGSSISFPLYCKGMKKSKSFLSSLSVAFIEVPSAIIAYIVGVKFITILPFMLAFAGASMICVATCELMPEAINKNKKIAILSMFIGFILMMTLGLILGWVACSNI